MSQQTSFLRNFLQHFFKGILNFELSEESSHREKRQWKKYIIVCFAFNAMSIGLVETGYKVFEDKLYGKTSRICTVSVIHPDCQVKFPYLWNVCFLPNEKPMRPYFFCITPCNAKLFFEAPTQQGMIDDTVIDDTNVCVLLLLREIFRERIWPKCAKSLSVMVWTGDKSQTGLIKTKNCSTKISFITKLDITYDKSLAQISTFMQILKEKIIFITT